MAIGRVAREHNEAEWHCAVGQDVGLLRANYVSQTFPRHWHDCYVVCVNERGAHASWYRGSTITIPAGEIAVVHPGEVHTGYRVPGHAWHYRAMYPSTELMETLSRQVGLPAGAVPSFSGLCVCDPDLADALLRTHRACEEPDDALQHEGMITDVLTALLRRHASGVRRNSGGTASTAAIDLVRQYVFDCFAERITLDSLGAAGGLSRYGVLRAFRKAVGIPPYAFVTQVRVERAKELLRAGVPIPVVARRTGFADQSHLTRHFRRLTGLTPGGFVRGEAH
jgi:AraC-like DNA-binding protein